MRASPAIRGLVVLVSALAGACGGALPTQMPPVALVSAPVPSPTPPPAPNGAPTISGDDRCIGALGADHVFVLVLDDPDGDTVAWVAEKDRDQGRLRELEGGPVPAGTSVTLVYAPPLDRADENWITVTARDARGATTVKRLYVRSG